MLKEGTYEIDDETAVAVAAGRAAEVGLAVRRTSLSEGSREATGVRIGVSEVEDGRKIAVTRSI